MVTEIEFDFKNALVSKKDINQIGKKLIKTIDKIKSKNFSNNDSLMCLNQPFDLGSLDQIKELSRQKRALHPEMIVIVGIGGSNLGTLALEKALIDEYKYHREGLPKLFYADTVDSNLMYKISKDLELTLAKGKNVLIIGISKSGTTLETLANFEILISSLKLYREDYQKYLVTISDLDSLLTLWAKENNISNLSIPSYVGGRYSVFSAVSLFPLSLIGINIDDLLYGAREMHSLCTRTEVSKNPAIISAAVHFYHYKKKINISNTFLFGKNLENLGNWYRQLLAESLGKEFDLKKKKVNVGLTPIVSLGTQDLHSMEQLFIAGPYDKFTTLVYLEKENYDLNVPLVSNTGLARYLQGYKLNEIMHSIIEGLKESFISKKRPFISVNIKSSSEKKLGEFMIWKMFEVIYLGSLMNVNPFDQPGVESYKKATREFMSKNLSLKE